MSWNFRAGATASVLYRCVQQHLGTWPAQRREGHDDVSVSKHVERELRRDLECGLLARGFAQARCGDCGHDFRIAFSCKRRGVCPSCNARRTVATAAHLTDHVVPPLPVRQRVLAVAFIHRFGSSLDAHSHFHCVAIDGVFDAATTGGIVFDAATGIEANAIAQVQAGVRRRLLRTFVRRRVLPGDGPRSARFRGGVATAPDKGTQDAAVRFRAVAQPRPRRPVLRAIGVRDPPVLRSAGLR